MTITKQKLEAFKQHRDLLRDDLEAHYSRVMNDYWDLYKDKVMKHVDDYATKREAEYNTMFLGVEQISLNLVKDGRFSGGWYGRSSVACQFTLKFLMPRGIQHDINGFWFLTVSQLAQRRVLTMVDDSTDTDPKAIEEIELIMDATDQLFNGLNELKLQVYP